MDYVMSVPKDTFYHQTIIENFYNYCGLIFQFEQEIYQTRISFKYKVEF